MEQDKQEQGKQESSELEALRERVTELEKLVQLSFAAQQQQIGTMLMCLQEYQQTIVRLTARYASQNTPEKWGFSSK